ncbi:MAG TPA: DUF6526 family protein [Thermoanaerobaculia bacterium]|nr:DUF6526 family protein [Thermoanaerobaculia bacterium]
MAENGVQAYANHRRFDPWYHFFVFPVVAISFVLALWTFVKSLSQGFSAWAAWNVVEWAAAIALTLIARAYPLKVQDRIIRLEERLRIATLLGGPLKARVGELDERQLVGLRFASDTEVPELVKITLDEKLSGEEIKKRIQSWRPDTFRV